MDLTTRLDTAIAKAIAEQRIVGAVTIVARDGEVIYRKANGHFDREANKPMFPEAIFRLASVTKPIVAATALAMIERDLIGLDNAVSDHLDWFRPKLADGSEPKITIRQLLTHTSGLTYDFRGDKQITGGIQATDLSVEENFKLYAARIPLIFEPGTGWMYGVSTDILGAVIERIHGGKLNDAVAHYITAPLDMKDTGFVVTDKSRLAPPYADGPPGLRRMGDPETVVYANGATNTFSPGRIFNRKAWQSGGAGGAGTADDLLKFFEAIRNRGTPILNPDSVAQAIQNQIGDLPQEAARVGQRFGYLGAVVVDPKAAGRPQAPGTIRWGGVYGHDWFIDFTNGITCISLTNTPIEGCDGEFPKEIARAIYDV
jgi:CubicO group peptidase (beta-lactamase class C family)